MKNLISISLLSALFLLQSCTDGPGQKTQTVSSDSVAKPSVTTPAAAETTNDAAAIMQKTQVPILCYHHIRSDVKPAEYTVSIEAFKSQMKWLADSGYQTILPDDYYEYLVHNKPLPPKPVMLTFDDTRKAHYDVAAPEMKRYGFKGVFYIMTVAIGKPGYMTRDEIKTLSDDGNLIGIHTYDHQNVKHLHTPEEWEKQLDKPRKTLEDITGKKVDHFAYPFGIWNDSAVYVLKSRNIKTAYQLSDKRKEDLPLLTLRRMIVPGQWKDPAHMGKWMRNLF
jgi:peptidoglycan/xylan/chitin deacetylase (PgdA/CDA1 family)